MIRKAVATLVVVIGLGLALAGSAAAHPLGNFTVNHYAGIELAGNRLYVRYVLELAEIPTLQSGAEVRRPSYAADVAQRLELRIGGARVPLEALRHRVTEREGAGGLPTLRFEAILAAPLRGAELTFEDHTYENRIGWREITVVARDGARLGSSSAPSTSRSNELRAYPKDLLASPLDIRKAVARFTAGTKAGAPPALGDSAAPRHTRGGFEALINRGELSLGLILVSLLVAAFWGAAHALTPGHGKALVAGYLVGTRGRPRHAFVLGATVTITHTIGVFALGVVTLVLSQFIVPEQLYPWLTLASGLLVIAVGLGVLGQRLHGRRARDEHGHHHHHGHDHRHHHHHDHPRAEPHDHHHDDITSKGIVGVGIAAGLLPCPSALVVLLSAIALHRVGFGLALIVAFSVGLAATITGIGLLAVLARRAFSRARFDGRVIQALPAVSALVIVVAGVAITARAIPGVV
jgi:ABC-type nickel/cobalt efflux system permease component RcnA